MRINESDLRYMINEALRRFILSEEYVKWVQSEPNNAETVEEMIRSIFMRLDNIHTLSPSELWKLVRDVGYLNHSAFKVNPAKWNDAPDEKLSQEDYALNKRIYAAKKIALIKLAKFYVDNHLGVSMNPEGTMLLFRNPVNNIRQITFHFKAADFDEEDWNILNSIVDREGKWDGVKMAHRFDNDDDYTSAPRLVSELRRRKFKL